MCLPSSPIDEQQRVKDCGEDGGGVVFCLGAYFRLAALQRASVLLTEGRGQAVWKKNGRM